MKKFLSSAATVAFVAASFAPAYAASPTPVTLGSLPLDQQTKIINTCKLAENGMFKSTPKDLLATVQVGFEVSRKTIQNIDAGTELSRTPFVYKANSEHKSGQSPNIFGDFTSTVTYSGGLNIQEVKTVDRTTVTFGCAMSKDNGITFPSGQQIPNDGKLSVNYDANPQTKTDTVAGDNYTDTITEDRVICNSPSLSSKKTAANGWANHNGYTGVCSTTIYNMVNPGGTHSNSVPGLTPLRPNTDHDEPLPLDSLDIQPIVLDDETAA